jgi:hypothetical protein
MEFFSVFGVCRLPPWLASRRWEAPHLNEICPVARYRFRTVKTAFGGLGLGNHEHATVRNAGGGSSLHCFLFYFYYTKSQSTIANEIVSIPR